MRAFLKRFAHVVLSDPGGRDLAEGGCTYSGEENGVADQWSLCKYSIVFSGSTGFREVAAMKQRRLYARAWWSLRSRADRPSQVVAGHNAHRGYELARLGVEAHRAGHGFACQHWDVRSAKEPDTR
jgi:hypothetical protein